MDSNISDLYQFKDDLNDYFKNFTNLINTDTYSCFKMRHANGDQPDKFGEFIYDTIDRCYIPKDKLTGSLISIEYDDKKKPYQGKDKYNTVKKEIRGNNTNNTKRTTLKKFIIEGRDEYKHDNIANFNELSVFDKKTKNDVKIYVHKTLGWTDNMTENGIMGRVAGISTILNSSMHINDDNKYLEMFKGLYPNKLEPSDHPPFLVGINKKIETVSNNNPLGNQMSTPAFFSSVDRSARCSTQYSNSNINSTLNSNSTSTSNSNSNSNHSSSFTENPQQSQSSENPIVNRGKSIMIPHSTELPVSNQPQPICQESVTFHKPSPFSNRRLHCRQERADCSGGGNKTKNDYINSKEIYAKLIKINQ